MTPQQKPTPAATERRPENLALAFQELLTVGERLRSHRQQVADPNAFREQIWEAVKAAQSDALKRGYNGDDVELALFAVIAYMDESILVIHAPVFADWPRMPLQQQRYGHDIAGEVFFQNLQKILGRSENHDLADLLEVYYLCLLLGFAGRYSVGGRGELSAVMQATADKIRRIRKSSGEISPRWALPNEPVHAGGSDPLVRGLLIATAGCFALMLVLFIFFQLSLSSGVSAMRAIAVQGL
jgi:type VI secretion system protein ImpK